MTVTNVRCHGDRGIAVAMLAVIVLTYAWGRRGRPWMAMLVVFIITVDGSTGVDAFFAAFSSVGFSMKSLIGPRSLPQVKSFWLATTSSGKVTTDANRIDGSFISETPTWRLISDGIGLLMGHSAHSPASLRLGW